MIRSNSRQRQTVTIATNAPTARRFANRPPTDSHEKVAYAVAWRELWGIDLRENPLMSGNHRRLRLAAQLFNLGCRRSIDFKDDTFEDTFFTYAVISNGKQNWSWAELSLLSTLFVINIHYQPQPS